MKDLELSNLPWMYTPIRAGTKQPLGANWPNNPKALADIQTENIGVILGPTSGGLCAIDFDGIEAIEHFESVFPNIDYNTWLTPIWTSGKDYRFQAAFIVPEMYWQKLQKKVINHLEFRWTGGQSVLPPSRLEDGRQYFWIRRPSEVNVMPIPYEILSYWLLLMLDNAPTATDTSARTSLPEMNIDEEEVNKMLAVIAEREGTLQGQYDRWRDIAWATCSSVGLATAEQLLRYYWPYKTNKEIQTLRAWRQDVNGPKIGTLVHLAGPTPEQKLRKLRKELGKKYG